MQDREILYQAVVKKFTERHWELLWNYTTILCILLFIPLLNLNGNKFIYILWEGIMLGIIVMMYLSTRKWAMNQIRTVSLEKSTYRIEVVMKDKTQVFLVHKDDLKVFLRWEGGRPAILRLSLFNKSQHLVDVYSGGKRKWQEAIVAIAYGLGQTQQPSPTSR